MLHNTFSYSKTMTSVVQMSGSVEDYAPEQRCARLWHSIMPIKLFQRIIGGRFVRRCIGKPHRPIMSSSHPGGLSVSHSTS